MSTSNSLKAIFYAFGANSGIAIAKSVAAFFTGSGSLLAEALHSWSDCINQIMLLIGMKQSKRKPDLNHPITKAQMTKTNTPEELIHNINVVEEKMQAKFNVKWSFFEPDIKK
jgi:Co/Zn/Cd efflux system component